MLPEQKQNSLIRFLAAGLLEYSKRNTLNELGDRSQYIGLSDIGKTMECMRSAVADKAGITNKPSANTLQLLSDEQVAVVLKKQLILQRGHWQEYGIQKAIISTGSHCLSQLEIAVEHNGVPIKAHLDFTIVRDHPVPAVRILELKSNEHIPEHLYASYEAQLYGQIGMLYENWNESCFSMSSVPAQKTFPELVKEQFDVELPDDPSRVDIEAWVVSISMSEIKPFGPYTYNSDILRTCYEKAEQLWSCKNSIEASAMKLADVPFASGFHPLCDYCSVNDNCPKFDETLVHDDEYNLQLDLLADLKEQEKVITQKKKHLEKIIKDRFGKSVSTDDNWLSTGKYRFKVTLVPGRKSINYERFSELAGKGAENLMQKCQETGKPYERLYVSRIN